MSADPTNSEQVEAVDWRLEAKRWTAAADREAAAEGYEPALAFAAVAQNYATLALVDEVAKLREAVGDGRDEAEPQITIAALLHDSTVNVLAEALFGKNCSRAQFAATRRGLGKVAADLDQEVTDHA